ncbi:MAG: RNA polymerase factor sigma-54 [Bacteroidales bacterium]|jgi:RNA polymerase sigma-54 factor|nr:RNA polymerase factor sigma-54 [Bacteroidales bacterium]
MIRQTLEQKQLQKLSPQQIMLMKLIQVPVASLEERIKEEIMENPALEDLDDPATREIDQDEKSEYEDEHDEDGKDDEFELSDYLDEDDYDGDNYKLRTNNTSADYDFKEIPMADSSSFHDFLMAQIGLFPINEKQEIIAQYIIGNIESSGYLEREIYSIVDDLAFNQNISATEEEVEYVLKEIIQKLDPPGIGAQNLQDCLLIQLKRHENPSNKDVILATTIIEDYFTEFTKKHYERILARLDISEDELRKAMDEILKLNPKPGGSVDKFLPSEYIIPDFTIMVEDDELEISLDSKNLPELKIKRSYTNMLENATNKQQKAETIEFIKQKIDSAKWFIEAISQRYRTLEKTMTAIAEFQKEFFITGDETKLKPMILKDIAEIVDLDISTVSRVANSKYVQTPFGTYLLKYFFSESLTNESGEEVSTREVKQILTNIVDAEDKRKPVTDEKLAAILKEKGYNIARRTVAKYREQLNIPVARLRKEI